jgi:hypothetical protein
MKNPINYPDLPRKKVAATRYYCDRFLNLSNELSCPRHSLELLCGPSASTGLYWQLHCPKMVDLDAEWNLQPRGRNETLENRSCCDIQLLIGLRLHYLGYLGGEMKIFSSMRELLRKRTSCQHHQHLPSMCGGEDVPSGALVHSRSCAGLVRNRDLGSFQD